MKVADFPEFVWIWNHLQGQNTPDLHIEIARWLAASRKGDDPRLLLMAFRNSGKSTLAGLYCAWLLMWDPNLRILVMAADLALARKMARNVKRIVERHPLCQNLRPRQMDQWASERFTVERPGELRDPSMLAKGIGANVTGCRADVVICDDVEVPNTCDTPSKREDLRDRLHELDYVLVPGGQQLFIGTPHTYYTIYASKPRREAKEDAPFLDGFKRLELPLYDETGASRWPERFSLEKAESIRQRTGPHKFASQMMLKPANIAQGRLDPDRLLPYSDQLIYSEGNGEATLTLAGRKLVSASCWWDPSYGSPGKGDDSVVAAVFTDEDGDYWLHRIKYLEHDPMLAENTDEATQMCRKVVAFIDELILPAATIETNGLGRFLPSLLRRELSISGVSCAVIEACSRRNKALRIIDAFDAVLAASRLHAHRSVWETPFISEMREWTPSASARDDGLDAVSGCLLSEPVRLRRAPPPDRKSVRARISWRPKCGGYQAKTEFPI